MAKLLDNVSVDTVGASYEWPGGEAGVLVYGDLGGSLWSLEVSFDGVNFAPCQIIGSQGSVGYSKSAFPPGVMVRGVLSGGGLPAGVTMEIWRL